MQFSGFIAAGMGGCRSAPLRHAKLSWVATTYFIHVVDTVYTDSRSSTFNLFERKYARYHGFEFL